MSWVGDLVMSIPNLGDDHSGGLVGPMRGCHQAATAEAKGALTR